MTKHQWAGIRSVAMFIGSLLAAFSLIGSVAFLVYTGYVAAAVLLLFAIVLAFPCFFIYASAKGDSETEDLRAQRGREFAEIRKRHAERVLRNK